MTIKLVLQNNNTQTVYLNDKIISLHLSASDLFSQLPPNDYQWERAIQIVEDAISPLVKEAKEIKRFELYSEILQPLAKQNVLSREIVEQVFQQVSRYGFDQAISQTVENYLHLLIVREWLHHFGYDEAEMV